MKTQRTFIVGDQWLYYKIYCGVKTADTILIEAIKPLTEKLQDNKWIEKWFFIRYNDPEPHLRIRFKVTNTDYIGNIIATVKSTLESYINNGSVWNLTIDTYNRELERYGDNTMDIAEKIFFIDSENILRTIEIFNTEEARLMYTLKSVNDIVSLCIEKNFEKLAFLEKMQSNFKKEFKVERITKKELDTKYRVLRTTIADVLTSNPNEYIAILKLLKTRNEMLKSTVLVLKKHEENNTLQVSISNMIASFIHMTINRVFTSKQRLYEMIIYDFLYRHYKSELARKKNTK